MAFVEDPTVFLDDFGVTVTAGAVSGSGILDMPDEYIADGMVITTEYTLRAEASKFGGLLYSDAVTVDGQSYEVRNVRLVDDGVFALIQLTRITAQNLINLLLETGDDLLLEDGGLILLEA